MKYRRDVEIEVREKVRKEGIVRRNHLWESLFVVILAFYPLRHIYVGLDLWDTGYNYANFTYMGVEHMDPMWLFSTYLANAVGHFLTRLPNAGGLVGMNFYTGLFAGILALLGYWFCTRKLDIQPWIAFVGEMMALSLCWCPTALLYNYLTYVLFLAAVIFLYQGLVDEKKGYLVAAGVCLGMNVLVRFSNLPEAAMILAVWAYDVILWLEGRKTEASSGNLTEMPMKDMTDVAAKKTRKTVNEGFWRRIVRHTGWCLLGYVSALIVLLGYIQLRYGLGEYAAGIMRLFAMTGNATDYKATSMILGMVLTYADGLYWATRIGIIALGGVFGFAVFGLLREYFGSRDKVWSGLYRLAQVFWAGVAVAMVVWLYYRRFCSFEFFTYDAMLRPGILFLMLTMLIAAIRIFDIRSKKEEKLISGMLILVILLTSLGSNNKVYPSLNNLFVAAPYTLWESWKFLKNVGNKKIARVTIFSFPVKCILTAFLTLCAFQFAVFGAKFVFAEATGVQDISAVVEDNEILKNVKMSREKAQWISELNAYVEEEGLRGQEVILYGDIPAISYYMQMPAAVTPWMDLDSYTYETMQKDMEDLSGEKPIIILENVHALYRESGAEVLKTINMSEEKQEKICSDKKWELLLRFMEEKGYRQTFRNEKFAVYR